MNLNSNTDVKVAAGATLEFDNRLNLMGNTLTKTGAGEIQFNSNVITGNGTVDCQEGTCSGSGTVSGDLNNGGGTVSPGNSPGVLDIEGNYTQSTEGLLLIELGGTDAGVDHDVLKVGGVADLAGELEVTLIDGFQPELGDSFAILDFEGLSGGFEQITLPSLAGGLAWNASQLNASGSLSVALVPEPCSCLLLTAGFVGIALVTRDRRFRMNLASNLVRHGALVVLSMSIVTLSSGTVSAQWSLVDDFNRADSAVVGNGWTEIESTGGADDSTGAQTNLQVLNNTLQLEEPKTPAITTHGNLPLGDNAIVEGTTGTLYFQLTATPPDPPEYYGMHMVLGDLAPPNQSTNGYTVMAINSTSSSGWTDPNPNQLVHNGGWGEFDQLAAGQLYNYWWVVDTAANAWDIYRTTDENFPGAADLLVEGAAYRVNNNNDLITLGIRLLGENQGSDQLNIDNIYMDTSGENLTFPFEVTPPTGFAWSRGGIG